MNINYYYLWNYNKFPFVYSIMKKSERNILIINIHNSYELRHNLSKLKALEKIDEVVLLKNTLPEYLLNLLYRVFIYPFKKKNHSITFYLDGFVGYYPLSLANIGVPDNISFYEEGESIYQDGVLFVKMNKGLKNTLNTGIKKILRIKFNSITDIDAFYVRNADKLKKVLFSAPYSIPDFEVKEIDEIKALRHLSLKDKEVLLDAFFTEMRCDFSQTENRLKRAIVLTQPIELYGEYNRQEAVSLFNAYIQRLIDQEYKVYLKLHPYEKEDQYISDGVERLKGNFPFELLALFDIQFDMGLTYNSTAVNSSLIKSKILIKNELMKKNQS